MIVFLWLGDCVTWLRKRELEFLPETLFYSILKTLDLLERNRCGWNGLRSSSSIHQPRKVGHAM